LIISVAPLFGVSTKRIPWSQAAALFSDEAADAGELEGRAALAGCSSESALERLIEPV
jgi:hypothetical protein